MIKSIRLGAPVSLARHLPGLIEIPAPEGE